MPIDPTFREKREIVDQIDGIDVWGPIDPPESLGIVGTDVAVDWDICEGNGVCLEVCPVQLYEWRDTLGHPGSNMKAFPAREGDCIKCMACEAQCPVEAISISYLWQTGMTAPPPREGSRNEARRTQVYEGRL